MTTTAPSPVGQRTPPLHSTRAHSTSDPTTLGRLYGRRRGRPLRAGRQAVLEQLLPAIAPPTKGPLNAERLFGHPCRLHFEIGFGGGEHIIARAQTLPQDGFLGAEVFLNGVAQALAHIDTIHKTAHKSDTNPNRRAKEIPHVATQTPIPDDGKQATYADVHRAGDHRAPASCDNIRLHHGDALDILQRLPDGGVDYIYLLHPDPWPKSRHSKRRMINDGPIQMIVDKLAAGGEFRFSTDHPIYLSHALAVMRRFRADFIWLCEHPQDFLCRPQDWPATRYEIKARKRGVAPYYFRWRKRSRDSY